jgi:hypothetical protein
MRIQLQESRTVGADQMARITARSTLSFDLRTTGKPLRRWAPVINWTATKRWGALESNVPELRKFLQIWISYSDYQL